MNNLERVVKEIVDYIEKDIKEFEERYGKYERTTMADYLNEIRWGDTSKDFKEEILSMFMWINNENFRKGIKGEDIDIMDDGSVESEGKIYSYRQVMSIVRNKVFKNNEEEE